MQSALYLTTKVLPGNRIELDLPPGSEGQEVNVFIVLPEVPNQQSANILEFLAAARSQYAGKTAKEIDQQLRIERDLWDS